MFAAIVAAAVAVSWGHRNLVGVTTLSTAWARGIRIAGSGQGLLVLFLIGYAVELVLYAYVGFLFDRFLFPMVPVAAILLLRGIRRPLVPGRSCSSRAEPVLPSRLVATALHHLLRNSFAR